MQKRFSPQMRPDQNAVYKPEAAPPQRVERQGPGFSPLLTALLTITGKDGLVNKTPFSLLKDIYPYASAYDWARIEQLLASHNAASEIMQHPMLPHLEAYNIKRPLTNEQRFLGMLRVLRKYGGQNADVTFAMLERMLAMKHRMDNVSHGGGMGDVLSMLGGLPGVGGGPANTANSGPLSNMAGMMQMMNLMNGMNNGGMSNLAGLLGGMNGGGMPNLAGLMSGMNGGGMPNLASMLGNMGNHSSPN